MPLKPVKTKLLEQYIGALHEYGNPQEVCAWLEGLFTPYITTLLRDHATMLASPIPTANHPISHPIAPSGPTLRADPVGSAVISASSAPVPANALMHLNQTLDRNHASEKFIWEEDDLTALAGHSGAPQWRFRAIFDCKDGKKRIVATAIDARKKVAKNAAAHEAYQQLRKMGELQT